jgi:hypothetical protein
MTLAGTYFATALLIKFILESLGKIYQGFEIRKLTSNTMGAGKLIASTLFNVFYITAMNEKFSKDKNDHDNKSNNNDSNNSINNNNTIYPKTDIGQLAIQYPGTAPVSFPFYGSSQQGFGIPPPNYSMEQLVRDNAVFSRHVITPVPQLPPRPLSRGMSSSQLSITESRHRKQPEIPKVKLFNPEACTFIPLAEETQHDQTQLEITDNDQEIVDVSITPEVDRNGTGMTVGTTSSQM